jgi:hypothetical protein
MGGAIAEYGGGLLSESVSVAVSVSLGRCLRRLGSGERPEVWQ